MKVKKWLFAFTAAVLVALAAFGLAACDEDDGEAAANAITHPEEYVGTYMVESAQLNGIVIQNYEIGDTNIFGTNNLTLTEDYIVLVLKADGTATVTSKHPESLQCFTGTKEGTWGIRGGKWIELPVIKDNMPKTIRGCSFDNEVGKIQFKYTMTNGSMHVFNLVKQAA